MASSFEDDIAQRPAAHVPVDFDRERDWWNAKAETEERDRGDEAINRALRWREIDRHLDGVTTVLDIGGGTGAFSIPLAARGCHVTHLDFSPAMLNIARAKAEGMPNIRFVEANAVDLSMFEDQSFDMVLNMDGAISFCGSEAERALLETCRVTRKVVIITAFQRAWMTSLFLAAGLQSSGQIVPAAYDLLDYGVWHQDAYPENEDLTVGMTQDYLGTIRAFFPRELKAQVEATGLRVLRSSALGTLANLCGGETIEAVMANKRLLSEFLDLCERFDLEIMPDGPGTYHRSGLLAVAVRE